MSEDQRAPWEIAVQNEAMAYVSAVQHNFKHGLEKAVALAPNPKDQEQRAIILDVFLDATCGLFVQFVAEYFNEGERAEVQSIKMMQDKFAYIRTKKAEADAAKKKTLGPSGLKVVPGVQ